jgi:hypothetical protein
MEIGQADALLPEGVHGRSPNHGIPKARIVAVSDVIGHHQDDIRKLFDRCLIGKDKLWGYEDHGNQQ